MFRSLRPYQVAVDASVAVLFALVSLPYELGTSTSSSYDIGGWGAIPVVLLLSGALGLRRFSPGLALAVAWGGAIVQMGLGRGPGFADIAIFAVLFATAAYGTRLVFWLGLASVVVGSGTITIYLFRWAFLGSGSLSDVPTLIFVLLAALFALGLSWTAGALVRTAMRARANRAAQSRAEEQTVAEQERTRIARDMHDIVAHSLAVIIAQSDGARYAAASDPDAQAAALGTISSTARSALSDVRLLLTQLRHSQAEGPQPTLADLEQLYAQVRAAGVELRVDVDPAPRGEVAASVQLSVYRILQEALTNALRHGAATGVDVSLAWHPDRVELRVRNEVAPVPEGAERRTGGHGLIGMRERAQLIGGRLDAAAADGVFTVEASLPTGSASENPDPLERSAR
ncbi:signal transduction histidine kinase [Microbacterium sp. SORGH_AS 505]|uniref:sensor histidine kinase n=1 Tax=Microbacterium sp. SORGH_AS_0505 TaxID=3041770 RepID=UPI0027855E3C|nr:histidine kinase [Microbacterium sp. SORGH_AS_0505]MDQ1126388.1 signal transduction histidine kinase [Microbacterium sp. SORGH_AS_0505]